MSVIYKPAKDIPYCQEGIDAIIKLAEENGAIERIVKKGLQEISTGREATATPGLEKPSPSVDHSHPSILSIHELLAEGSLRFNGFNKLFNGDTSQYDGDNSRAEQALCNFLAILTDCNHEMIYSMMLMSGFPNKPYEKNKTRIDKWESIRCHGISYINATIQKAIDWAKDKCNRKHTYKTYHSHDSSMSDQEQTIVINRYDALDYASRQQVGAGDLFSILNKDKLLFDHSSRRWYKFDNNRWRPDYTDSWLTKFKLIQDIYNREADKLIKAISRATKEEKKSLEEMLKTLTKGAAYLDIVKNCEAAAKAAVSGSSPLADDGQHWDVAPYLLPVGNGVVDLRTGLLRPGRPSDRLLKGSDVLYDENAKAPTWRAYLDSSFGGCADTIAYLQRLMGYCACRDPREQVFVIMTGRGRNGKGVMLNTIGRVLGEIAGPIQNELLLDSGRHRSSAGPSPDRLALRGRGLVWASETKADRSFDEGLIKALSGGDPIVARAPYGKEDVHFEPRHTVIFLCNDLPKVSPTDFALWQRVHVVPFEISFVKDPDPNNPKEKQRIDGLEDILKAEYSGILNWIIQGALEWQRIGLSLPQKGREAVAKYQQESDLLSHFFEDRCKIDQNAHIGASKLYEEYKDWAEQAGIKRPLSSVKFASELQKRGIDKYRHKTGYRYIGIDLLQQD